MIRFLGDVLVRIGELRSCTLLHSLQFCCLPCPFKSWSLQSPVRLFRIGQPFHFEQPRRSLKKKHMSRGISTPSAGCRLGHVPCVCRWVQKRGDLQRHADGLGARQPVAPGLRAAGQRRRALESVQRKWSETNVAELGVCVKWEAERTPRQQAFLWSHILRASVCKSPFSGLA